MINPRKRKAITAKHGVGSSVGHYSTQSSGSNTPATQLITLLYSKMPLLYSLLYSETHYSTQKVAGVTEILS